MATGFPFGAYAYSGALGPKLLGVPLIIPLAWTWMAWPAWLAAAAAARAAAARIALAAAGLAAWDLFLDPQMVAEGYWRWHAADARRCPACPASRSATTWAGWVALLLMAVLRRRGRAAGDRGRRRDAPMLALYLWTYASSRAGPRGVPRLPASALWGGVGMGAWSLPLRAGASQPPSRRPRA